jgi:hypothetical protein
VPPKSPTPPQPIEKKYLIIGEGSGDARFMEHLCEARKIEGFQIEDARGNEFLQRLSGLRDRTGFDGIKGILIVSDNDDEPAKSFIKIRRQIKQAKLPYPNKPLALARLSKNEFAIAVMMIPFTIAGGATKGCLETLFLQAIEPKNVSTGACVTNYRACIAGGGRTKNEEDKFRFRCFVSALHQKDPNLSTSFVASAKKGLIDLDLQCFDEIANWLKGFPNLCFPPTK